MQSPPTSMFPRGRPVVGMWSWLSHLWSRSGLTTGVTWGIEGATEP